MNDLVFLAPNTKDSYTRSDVAQAIQDDANAVAGNEATNRGLGGWQAAAQQGAPRVPQISARKEQARDAALVTGGEQAMTSRACIQDCDICPYKDDDNCPIELTVEEIAAARAIDAQHIMDNLPAREAEKRESDKAYNAAHKAEEKESNKAYYAVHKAERKEYRKAYYAAHKVTKQKPASVSRTDEPC